MSGSNSLEPRPDRPQVVPLLPLGEPFAGEGEINVSEYLALLRRQWRLIAVIGLIGAAVGAILYATTPRVYQARARIQIERRSFSPLNSQGTNWLEAWWNPEYYPTQFEILKSRGLAEEVLRNLRLWEDPDFNPHAGSIVASDEPVIPAQDEAALGGMASRLQSGLTIRPRTGTQLVDILYSSQHPELAMRVANGFAETFQQRGKADRQRAASRASTFLSEQIEEIKTEIADKERQLQTFSRERDIVTIDKDSNTTLKRLEAVNQDYITARSDRIQKEVRYNELVASSDDVLADTLSDTGVRSLGNELRRAEEEYAAKLRVYKPEFPDMVELRGTIDDLRARLRELVGQAREQARVEYQTALRSEQRLNEELRQMKNETLALNSASAEYNNLKVEIATRRQLLDELLRRQSETSVAVRGSQEPNVHIIEKALLPGRPSEPNLKRQLLFGGGIGLLVGIGLVFLLDFMDRSIKTPEELERRLGLPVLAVIPDISTGKSYGYLGRYGYGSGHGQNRKKRSPGAVARRDDVTVDLVPQHKPRLAISESYRSLRTALLLSSADTLQVITVTSATSGEGKTVTAANLATVLAQLGRRVLLIDADLRKPRVHKVFKISNRVGVVNYLVGRAEAEEIFFRNGVPNLAVSPAGPSPPNPSELLSSPRMQQLLERAREIFDYVIVDTPPTLAVTDSTIMGSASDGVVLTVRAGAIPREDAKVSAERLRLAGVKVLGTVLNCYRPLVGRFSKDYHYYYYQAYAEDQETV